MGHVKKVGMVDKVYQKLIRYGFRESGHPAVIFVFKTVQSFGFEYVLMGRAFQELTMRLLKKYLHTFK